MQKDDNNNQQQQSHTSEEISQYSSSILWFNGAPHTSIASSNDGPNYADIVKVLSQVELPSPSPILQTAGPSTREGDLITFDEGQPSGTKKVDEIEVRLLKSLQC